jgi:pimeloyl-ACP methyl ester carboxylesterase
METFHNPAGGSEMAHLTRAMLFLTVFGLLLAPISPAWATSQPPTLDQAAQMAVQGLFSQCTPDQPHQNSPAIYRICRPPWWWANNDDLVIWAHGYVDALQPVEIPEDQLCLPNGLCIPDVLNFLGYNFATTSYAVNGLAVRPGIQDVIELVDLYTQEFGAPEHVLLVGASEGGLITALAVEQHPEIFDGGLSTCGPIGNFRWQVNYFGNFRIVFDYFFSGLIPGTPVEIPPELLPIWETYYDTNVAPVVFDPANQSALAQLLNVTKVPFQRSDLSTIGTTVEDVLWYNTLATNNATEVLGGQPFDNTSRWYRGSLDDETLNAEVARFAADAVALQEIEDHYQTTGILSVPLVTLHTVLDQQVPYWHEILYLQKTKASGAWPVFHENYSPTLGYGHCAFSTTDVLGAFGLLVTKTGAETLDAQKLSALLRALEPDQQVLDLDGP